jgi:hypothetical protein
MNHEHYKEIQKYVQVCNLDGRKPITSYEHVQYFPARVMRSDTFSWEDMQDPK